MSINLCDKRKQLLQQSGHLLIQGGPGSGKTTISLLKAQQIIQNGQLQPFQKVLFLSFARATVTRIMDDSTKMIDQEDIAHLEVNTYHGFSWNLLRSFGYLVSPQWPLKIATPPLVNTRLAGIEEAAKPQYLEVLLREEGLLSFDLFAPLVAELLSIHAKVRDLVCDKYPVIIVDEFQDTNDEEWKIIKNLATKSIIIALADPEQRIYDFRGAKPERILELRQLLPHNFFDFGNENNRSGHTDIATFGNDLLKGLNKGKSYNNVTIQRYPRNWQEHQAPLKYAILNAIKRMQKKNTNNWSIAILVRSNNECIAISDYLQKASSQTPTIHHEILIDPMGPALAANVIAHLLEPTTNFNEQRVRLFTNLLNHIKGRNPKGASQTDVTFTQKMEEYLVTGSIRGKNRLAFIQELDNLLIQRGSLVFSGIPEQDWLMARNLFKDCTQPYLRSLFEDARFIRLLRKGNILSERLSASWRQHGAYRAAQQSIEAALLQEHFSLAKKKWQGVFVMTIHKSKGKEFDEVIIWEDIYRPMLHKDATIADVDSLKLALRVGVTRARHQTTILTPAENPCPFW